MKKLEKWLARPLAQRFVYLLLMLACFHISTTNGMLNRLMHTPEQVARLPIALLLMAVILLGVQLLWNKLWGWRAVCAAMLGFTFWLATLSLPAIIAGAGSGAATVVWGVGVIGFTALLVVALAFTNWVLLHMRPKKG